MVWRNTQTLGTDFCTLHTHPSGYDLLGTVIAALDTRPYLVRYEVRCDKVGRTKEVEVSTQSGERKQHLHLEVDDEQRWWRNGQEVGTFRDLVDVDLGVTPATNTLPIRRLGLGSGESREVTAVWVKFPELTLERLPQCYTRLSERHYRYESEDFIAEIETDEVGLIKHYSDGWVVEAAYDNAGE